MKIAWSLLWVFLITSFTLSVRLFAYTPSNNGGIFNDYKRALKVNPGEVEQLTLNGYEEIPNGVYKFKNLIKLTIRNGLKSIPNDINKIGKIESLILIDNPITSIPENIRLCIAIQEIKIINSQLQSLPSALFELPNLVSLTIKNGQLVSLPSITQDNYVLKILNLKNNRISSISEDIQHLIGLEGFYCSGNPIKTFIGEFDNPKAFKNFKTLVMRDCGLEHIPFVLCNNLQYLDVSGNKITDIDEAELTFMNNLLFIGLEDNPITYINEKLFSLAKLKSIQIDRYESLSIELSELSNVCITYIAVNMEIIDKNYKPCGQRKGMVSVFFSEPGKRRK